MWLGHCVLYIIRCHGLKIMCMGKGTKEETIDADT